MAYAQKRALVIGISDYSSSGFEQLDFCKNNEREVSKHLSFLGYEISDKNRLMGEVTVEEMRVAIYDFLNNVNNKPDGVLIFYYSGHAVSDSFGKTFLAASDTDPACLRKKGFFFNDLTNITQNSVSTKVVLFLDCCHIGSNNQRQTDEVDAIKTGRTITHNESRKLSQAQGESASQACQGVYSLTRGEHSIFTYYLLKGLECNPESANSEGNVTVQTLKKYIYRNLMSLSADERLVQTRLLKIQGSGDLILARYPELKANAKNDIISATKLNEDPVKTHSSIGRLLRRLIKRKPRDKM